MSTISDAIIIERCLGGDWQEFETLVTRYERPIFNAAFRIVGGYEDASDITQQTFVKAYENLTDYQSEYKFFSWIYRIAMNEALDHISRTKRQFGAEPFSIVTPKNPEELLQESETSSRIHDALQQLKPELRTVLVLRHFQDLSYLEMAGILKIAEKTVKSRLYTARQQLAMILRKAGLATHE